MKFRIPFALIFSLLLVIVTHQSLHAESKVSFTSGAVVGPDKIVQLASKLIGSAIHWVRSNIPASERKKGDWVNTLINYQIMSSDKPFLAVVKTLNLVILKIKPYYSEITVVGKELNKGLIEMNRLRRY